MDKNALIELAKRYFISDASPSEANLIRRIQVAEGNSDCFATGRKTCDQSACRWRKECMSEFEEQARADHS